jgi:uncharacterized protein YjiS (DUF1127 family)
MCDDASDLYASDHRRPTPREWAALRKCIIARAHEQRRQVIRQMVGATWGCIRLVDALRKASGLYLAWRKRLQELRELSEMSDIELRDIGISRLEIRAAMRSNAKSWRWQRRMIRRLLSPKAKGHTFVSCLVRQSKAGRAKPVSPACERWSFRRYPLL